MNEIFKTERKFQRKQVVWELELMWAKYSVAQIHPLQPIAHPMKTLCNLLQGTCYVKSVKSWPQGWTLAGTVTNNYLLIFPSTLKISGFTMQLQVCLVLISWRKKMLFTCRGHLAFYSFSLPLEEPSNWQTLLYLTVFVCASKCVV